MTLRPLHAAPRSALACLLVAGSLWTVGCGFDRRAVANLLPVAEGGLDQTVPGGAQVTLAGTGEDGDGDALV